MEMVWGWRILRGLVNLLEDMSMSRGCRQDLQMFVVEPRRSDLEDNGRVAQEIDRGFE